MANKVILIGALGADPELSYTPSGTCKAVIRIATTERWSDKNGEKQEHTEWHRVIAWGKKAEVIGEYFKKGMGIYVEGKLQTRSWEQDGQKKWATEIILREFEFLPGKRSESKSKEEPYVPQPDSDIPF